MQITFLDRFEVKLPDDQACYVLTFEQNSGTLELTFKYPNINELRVPMSYLSSLFLISANTSSIIWLSLTQFPTPRPYYVSQLLPGDEGSIDVYLSLATPEEVLIASQLDNLIKARNAFSEAPTLAPLTKSLSDLMLRIRKDYPRVY